MRATFTSLGIVLAAMLVTTTLVRAEGLFDSQPGDAYLKNLTNEDLGKKQIEDIGLVAMMLTAREVCGASHIDDERVFRIIANMVRESGLPENVFMTKSVDLARINAAEMRSDTKRVIKECDLVKSRLGPRE